MAKAKKETKVSEEGTANVYQGGELLRTYTAEVHGENYLELAKEFASKVPGREVA